MASSSASDGRDETGGAGTGTGAVVGVRLRLRSHLQRNCMHPSAPMQQHTVTAKCTRAADYRQQRASQRRTFTKCCADVTFSPSTASADSGQMRVSEPREEWTGLPSAHSSIHTRQANPPPPCKSSGHGLIASCAHISSPGENTPTFAAGVPSLQNFTTARSGKPGCTTTPT
jgi:hypothetical protein